MWILSFLAQRAPCFAASVILQNSQKSQGFLHRPRFFLLLWPVWWEAVHHPSERFKSLSLDFIAFYGNERRPRGWVGCLLEGAACWPPSKSNKRIGPNFAPRPFKHNEVAALVDDAGDARGRRLQRQQNGKTTQNRHDRCQR